MAATKDKSPEVDDDEAESSGPSGGSTGGGSIVAGGAATAGGFFHPYKKGQGKITRLATAVVAAGILGLTCKFLYSNISIRLVDYFIQEGRARDAAASLGRNIALGISAGFFLLVAFFAWKLMNSPKGVDFLITTDQEMKKVNWASRKELIGSTRVVVVFLIIVSLFLFFSDIFFGWFFFQIGVLKTGPFSS